VALNQNANDDKKEVIKLVQKFMKKLEKSYLASDYKNELDKLEADLKKLKDYGKDGTKKTKVYDSLDDTNKATYDKLVKGLQSKVDVMKEEKKKNEQNTGGGNEPEKP